MRVPVGGDLTAVAARVCADLHVGDVVAVSGDVGAGKTTLIRACAEHLGVIDPVTSPTFALVHAYRGPVPVVHVDLYRLVEQPDRDTEDVRGALDGDAIAFVEWPAVGRRWLPAPRRTVAVAVQPDGTRHFAIDDPDTP